ncbi:hypothetical protein D9M73_51690 [compost metagenome]|uniref:Uncharacterized protein n=1 Tax=Polaromonas aquatica TaxID=332657 RepID=A0ABW1TUS7_9BURK
MAKLLAIVEVDEAQKVQCQEPGCGHGVYKRIHVVDDGGKIMVMGSTCFEKRFGTAPNLQPEYSGNGAGRPLTDEQRQLLLQNTAQLIVLFDEEAKANRARLLESLERNRKAIAERQAVFEARSAVLRQLRAAEVPSPRSVPIMPWKWVKPMSSMAYFHWPDAQGWIRVMHATGGQVVMPWPASDGWDEALPPVVGSPDLELGGYRVNDIGPCISYLRKHAQWERIGIWRDIMEALAKHGKRLIT